MMHIFALLIFLMNTMFVSVHRHIKFNRTSKVFWTLIIVKTQVHNLLAAKSLVLDFFFSFLGMKYEVDRCC